MYRYLLYGLGVCSEMKLYNIPQVSVSDEVHIHYGNIKDNIYSIDCVVIRFPEVLFEIRNGNEIIIDIRNVEDNEHQITAYIIGLCMAVLLTQRKMTALHGTVLEINDMAVLVSGISGSGKSTTAGKLVEKGYRYLADDVASVSCDNGIKVSPAYPVMKICGDGISKLNSNQLLYINEARDKYSYVNIEDYCDTSKNLKLVIILKKGDTDQLSVKEERGFDKYLKVLECLFLANVYTRTDTPESDKSNCLKVAEAVKVYTIIRPKEGDTVSRIADIIEELAKKCQQFGD